MSIDLEKDLRPTNPPTNPFDELLALIQQQPTNRKGEYEIQLPYAYYNDATLSIKLRHDHRTVFLVRSQIEIVTGGIGYGLHPDFADFWLTIARKVLEKDAP
jgi:hypothetical protein